MYIVQTAETKLFDPVLSLFRTIGIWILQLYQIKEKISIIRLLAGYSSSTRF